MPTAARLLAVLLALVAASPADARRRAHTTCVPTYEPGVGPVLICAPAPRRR